MVERRDQLRDRGRIGDGVEDRICGYHRVALEVHLRNQALCEAPAEQ
jgi:hypothetical protein